MGNAEVSVMRSPKVALASASPVSPPQANPVAKKPDHRQQRGIEQHAQSQAADHAAAMQDHAHLSLPRVAARAQGAPVHGAQGSSMVRRAAPIDHSAHAAQHSGPRYGYSAA